MKILYVGDFRELPNWGCRSTGIALKQLLEKRHTVVASLGLETLNGTGWDSYARPDIRFGGALPRRIFAFARSRRHRHPRIASALLRLDRLFGAKHDFIVESPGQSIAQFHAARKSNPRLEEIHRLLLDCDAVVFNGEGTMILSNPVRRDVLFNLFFIALATACGKKIYFLNAMFSECPRTGLNQRTAATAGGVLAACHAVVCRDRHSADFVRRICPGAAVSTIPDALFTWKSKVEGVAALLPCDPDLALPFGFEHMIGQLDFRQPYVCISGSSSAYLDPDPVGAYARVAQRITRLGLRTYLVCTCDGDLFLHEVGRRTGLTVIPHTIPVLAGAAIVGGARLLVSGRFHPSIMASLAGTPCIFFGSNSHKTRTLQEVLEYPTIREFSDVPRVDEDDEIEARARAILAEGETRRVTIRQTTAKRSEQAQRILDIIDGAPPVSIL